MIYILNKLFKQLYEINAERTPARPCSLWPPPQCAQKIVGLAGALGFPGKAASD